VYVNAASSANKIFRCFIGCDHRISPSKFVSKILAEAAPGVQGGAEGGKGSGAPECQDHADQVKPVDTVAITLEPILRLLNLEQQRLRCSRLERFFKIFFFSKLL
jgi:hypothetical protein